MSFPRARMADLNYSGFKQAYQTQNVPMVTIPERAVVNDATREFGLPSGVHLSNQVEHCRRQIQETKWLLGGSFLCTLRLPGLQTTSKVRITCSTRPKLFGQHRCLHWFSLLLRNFVFLQKKQTRALNNKLAVVCSDVYPLSISQNIDRPATTKMRKKQVHLIDFSRY